MSLDRIVGIKKAKSVRNIRPIANVDTLVNVVYERRGLSGVKLSAYPLLFEWKPRSMRETSYPITVAVLAGGQGSRMGGLDKGMMSFQGLPLVQQVLERLKAQTNAPIFISANRSLAHYRALGYPVVEDIASGFQGPLMGLLSVLRVSSTPWTLCVPCDTPFLPADLLVRFEQALVEQHPENPWDILIAADPRQTHPVIALIRTALADDLAAFLASGERRMMAWYRRHSWQILEFAQTQAFQNLNTLEDLAAAIEGKNNGL